MHHTRAAVYSVLVSVLAVASACRLVLRTVQELVGDEEAIGTISLQHLNLFVGSERAP
jgi:hypothetical protein